MTSSAPSSGPPVCRALEGEAEGGAAPPVAGEPCYFQQSEMQAGRESRCCRRVAHRASMSRSIKVGITSEHKRAATSKLYGLVLVHSAANVAPWQSTAGRNKSPAIWQAQAIILPKRPSGRTSGCATDKAAVCRVSVPA